ncbi:single-stranded DNA-binding protein 2 [Lactococcus hodotermopsidis]|uniref:Single-stranded DNA-binding protein n=1 Tax=Pseudolactococcus hodotermopsidis TaxID=2709157 RepID=A0A6A0BFF8_9LACT|nr:single-stranded DNA-binding protein [Lactococcus hodotermopsidis]GFH43021.1 single-stranded DNA-binding protein 2 [Lactococcus hodotermopsidis]
MINNVVLVGRLTKDPELTYTPQNQAVIAFTLAVNRNFKNGNGERQADFISIVLWRQAAENFANWATKGALIGITGRIQTRNYEDGGGRRVYVTEVIADSFQMLESRAAREGGNKVQQAPNQPDFSRDNGVPPSELSDDNLPF